MATKAQKQAAREARRAKRLKATDKFKYARYTRDLKVRDLNEDNRRKDLDAAHKANVDGAAAVGAVFAKVSSEVDEDIKRINKEAATAEAAVLTQPVTIYTGASTHLRESIPMYHWRSQMPAVLSNRLGVPAFTDPGQALIGELPHGGGEVVNVVDMLVAEVPELAESQEFLEWAETVARLWAADVEPVSALLEVLRDADRWAAICGAAGVNLERVEKVGRVGRYCGNVVQPVTVCDVPSLLCVDFTDTGMELTFAGRPGDPAEKWGKAIPTLRAAFKTLGVPADALAVRESETSGDVVLGFNNATSSFPVAVAPPTPAVVRTPAEAIRNYPNLCWEFGVDARGNILRSKCKDSPHVALIAQTGWGKSVLSATIVEQMRCSGVMLMLFDGKGTDHPRHLGRQPGVIWLSKNPAEHMVGMSWVHAEMQDRYALVDEENDGPDTSKSFDFPPIVVLVDELPSLRGAVAEADKKDKGATFDWMMQDLLQKGRQCRIHLLLISQSLYVESMPGKFQTNITRTIFLGPVDSRSLMSDDINDEAKAQVVSLSARIPESAKGRAVFMARTDKGTVVRQFQSFYGFSPGNTSLDAAPTPEVREAWADAKAVSEQMPMLYDRIGIAVGGPEWRDQPMKELIATPTVIVADANGPIPGMERYDPLSREFAGASVVGANTNRARGRGAAGHGKSPAPAPPPAGDITPPPTTQSEPDLASILAGMTPEQHAALIAAATEQATPADEAVKVPAAPKRLAARKAPARRAPKTVKAPEPIAGTDTDDLGEMEFA